ncbi:hypothetical protein [Alkalicoccus luteus]|uniref:hypothetical protein n=1 Tax=Alkalicoccus luteus TaxID=1237094 RepID=UPI004033F894
MKGLKVLIAGLLAVLFVFGAAASAGAGSFGSDANKMLAETRAATAKYQQVERAEDDGYVWVNCVPGMGNHYVNFGLVETPGHDHKQPEVLVYEEMKNGKMKLAAVEFLGFAEEAPELYGQTFDDGPFGPGSYALHVWAWKHNKDGMFAEYNSAVSCQ